MIRVQMMHNAIPAYQADFKSESEALLTASRLAEGSNSKRVEHETDLALYEHPKGYVRVFKFADDQPAIVHSGVIVAMHRVLDARWKAAGQPAGAAEQCLWDLERLVDNRPEQQPVKLVLAEAIELLEGFATLKDCPAMLPHESACIEVARGIIAAENMSAQSDLPTKTL